MKRIILLFLFISSVSLSAQNADIELLRNINLNRNTQFDDFLIGVSKSVAPITYGLPLALAGVGLIKKDSLIVKQAIYIGFTVVSSAVLTNILKYSVDRARPAETYPDIDQVIETHSPSFPSGHTSSAFSLATSVSLVYPKWYVIVPAYTWASTVGYSRMALGVHYPSDVFMGAIIGAGSAFVCFKAQQWLDKKSKKDLSIRKKKN